MNLLEDISIGNYLEEIRNKCETNDDMHLFKIFKKNYLTTLRKAIEFDSEGNAFVITGDIPAMWQRDSAAQMRAYLPLAQKSKKIRKLIVRVIKRQFFNLNLDSYANAFNIEPNSMGHQQDHTKMTPWIFERKYELDSLCYPVQLAYLLYKETGEKEQFDLSFVNGIKKILKIFGIEQHHENSSYHFERLHFERPQDRLTGSLPNHGSGRPVAYTGMVWSGFRPSDDACYYNYLIPANMFAVVVLNYIVEIFSNVNKIKNQGYSR